MADKVITGQDVELLKSWFSAQKATPDVERIMERLLRMVVVLDLLVGRHKNLFKTFQEAMGITPKSERGAALSNQ